MKVNTREFMLNNLSKRSVILITAQANDNIPSSYIDKEDDHEIKHF